MPWQPICDEQLDFLIEDAKNHMQTWGSQNPTFLLCNGSLTAQVSVSDLV